MMYLLFEIFWNMVLPAVVAVVVGWAADRLLSEEISARYRGAAAVALGGAAGYLVLPLDVPVWPDQYWQWLSYLGVVAMGVGAIAQVPGVAPLERRLLYLLLGAIAAGLIVPTWSDLEPHRSAYVLGLTGYVLALCVLLEPLTTRFTDRFVAAQLGLAAWATVIAVAVFVSMKFGQVGTTTAAALLGYWGLDWIQAREGSVRGLIAVYAVTVGGLAFVGYINPLPTLPAMLLLPVAPLALWICRLAPLRRLSVITAGAVGTLAVLAALIGIFLWLFLVHG